MQELYKPANTAYSRYGKHWLEHRYHVNVKFPPIAAAQNMLRISEALSGFEKFPALISESMERGNRLASKATQIRKFGELEDEEARRLEWDNCWESAWRAKDTCKEAKTNRDIFRAAIPDLKKISAYFELYENYELYGVEKYHQPMNALKHLPARGSDLKKNAEAILRLADWIEPSSDLYWQLASLRMAQIDAFYLETFIWWTKPRITGVSPNTPRPIGYLPSWDHLGDIGRDCERRNARREL